MIARRLSGYVKLLFRLNIRQTLRLNFGMLKFSDAVKLPIYVFGPAKLIDIGGSIEFGCRIKRGMIEFGNADENIIATREPLRIAIPGKLVFNGTCKFSKAIQLHVGSRATVVIGDSAWFGSFTKIVAFSAISFGRNFMGSWECQIFDTDFHFVKSVSSGRVENNVREVKIGESVWLGSRVTILKGTLLPDYTIVGVGAICNKDYSISGTHIVLGGIPAKLLKSDVEYVTDKSVEKRLNKIFHSDPHVSHVDLNGIA